MKKILFVEDNQVIVGVYRNKLRAEGFQVEVAADGEVGLEMINHLKPDLVLLDLMLPKLNGVEILRRIRSQSQFKTLPVIAFSNSLLTDEAWEAGATQVLSKANHSPKQLVEEVRHTLSVASARQETPTSKLPDAPATTRPFAEIPTATDSDPDDAFRAELRRTCLDAAPETLAALRDSLQACVRGSADTTALFDLYRKAHALTGNTGLAGLDHIFRVSSALEALLKQQCGKPGVVNPSVLRTVGQAIEFLVVLFAHSAHPSAEEELPPALVLVVDDEEIARRAVCYSLEKANLQSVRVGESATALKLLSDNRFDLVLLDVEMPGMSGFELCSVLRAMPLHAHTPVVFLTSAAEFTLHEQSVLGGGADLIAKPFLYTELALKSLTALLHGQMEKRRSAIEVGLATESRLAVSRS